MAAFLTKSRFKQALECPTKLSYTGKPEYLNNSLEDSFLAALAQGGYQVGALACLLYPGGMTIDESDQQRTAERTRELLARDEVILYEATIITNGLLARVDILRKRGDVVELIEVKSKSYDPTEERGLRNNKGAIKSEFKPYLHDVAFQWHVARLAYPQLQFEPFLMLADKSKRTTVDGLNQHFPVRRVGARIKVTVDPALSAESLGEPILTAVPVRPEVEEITAGNLDVAGRSLPFAQAVEYLAAAYADHRRIGPVPSVACANCEFKASTPPKAGEARSGFHECWSAAFGWHDEDFARGTVLDVWNLRTKDQLIAHGVLKPSQITEQDLGFDGSTPGAEGLTRGHRQWYQCSGQWPGGGEYYLDREGIQAEMSQWRYPLHFIDFETCAVAIPFRRGQQPYETVAFQFSHHVMQADGRVEHRTQFLEATPGVEPNLPFLRALCDALSADDGTVFRWATHENTVLNQLRRQLLEDPNPPADAAGLITFIDSLTTRADDGWRGPRCMVDLCKLAERFYFHPATQGSSSLKKVLPALMSSSNTLRELYRQPVYGTAAMPSLNLEQGVAWWLEREGRVCDPYEQLPPVFSDVSREEQAALDAGLDNELREGGAAMAAYARLQFEGLDAGVRQAMCGALLRYCELDTLAMVMVVQGWMGVDRHPA